jgi:hypothetical protein
MQTWMTRGAMTELIITASTLGEAKPTAGITGIIKYYLWTEISQAITMFVQISNLRLNRIRTGKGVSTNLSNYCMTKGDSCITIFCIRGMGCSTYSNVLSVD